MNMNAVRAKAVCGGWLGEFSCGGRFCTVKDHRGVAEIFQSRAEAVAVAGMVLSKEVKSNA